MTGALAVDASPRLQSSDQVASWALAGLLALPWLWPFAPGPSPNVVPLLVAWCCLVAAVLVGRATATPLFPASLAALWLAALASSVIALLQWFGAAPATHLISPAEIGQAYANLRQRNQFATLTSLGLAVLVWRPPVQSRRVRVACLLLLAAANAASSSRTGILQWCVLLGLALAWHGSDKRRAWWCAGALGAYVLWSVLLPFLLWQLQGVDARNIFDRATAELGCSSRKVLWSNVVDLVLQRPWTGWGPGELDYAHYWTLYPGARFCDILDNAHNLPLHLAVELGVPVAVLATAGVLAAAWRAAPWRETDAARQVAWCVLVAIGLHSLLEYPLWYGPFQAATLLAVLALVRPRAPSMPVVAGACAAVLAIAAVVATDYQRVSQAYAAPEQRWPSWRLDPVASAGSSLFFEPQLRFAELSLLPVSRENAGRVHALAQLLLHYSPEPMVIEKLVESAALLGRLNEALAHLARYKAAFPDRYEAWAAANKRIGAAAPKGEER